MRLERSPAMLGLRGLLNYLTLLFLIIPSSFSLTPPIPNARIEQLTLPSGFLDGLSNSTVAVRMANQTLSGGREIACYTTPSEGHRLIKYMDCYSDMARGLLLGDDVMDRERIRKQNLPFSWNAGTCMIILSDKTGVFGTLQKVEIAHVAALITRVCVTHNEEPLGGFTSLGDRNQFTLTVYGRKYGGPPVVEAKT